MTTKVSNPHFVPELASRVTIIDFTMSQTALEQTLLSKVIGREQRSVEEQLNIHLNNINMHKSLLKEIGDAVLLTISTTEGSLLDNEQKVEELNKHKKKAAEATGKSKESKEKKKDLRKKRELYLGVAKRGTALYFAIQDMANINWMYSTSLDQFMKIFETALATAKKASTIKERTKNLSTLMTKMIFNYMNRALYTKDRVLFGLNLGIRIKLVEEIIKVDDIRFFTRAGAISDEHYKYSQSWMDEQTAMNLKALSKHKFGNETTAFFKDILDKITNNEDPWKVMKSDINPEAKTIPEYNEKLAAEKELGAFMTLCLMRCIREDRTIMSAYKFIADPSVLGPEFENPTIDSLEDVYAESNSKLPVLCLLSDIYDPSLGIEELCRKKLKRPPIKITMGEGQENIKGMIEVAMAPANINTITWVILQNCQYGLQHLESIMSLFTGKGYTIRDEFRLFMTTAPTNDFPLELLHFAVKVTSDPPRGLRAGMIRTFTQVVNQDRLEKVDAVDVWKNVIWIMCFMHNILRGRCKYGPIGFCHPYDFSNSDLDTTLSYLERLSPSGNFDDAKWKMAKYIVCEIQYGGKVIDERDLEVLNYYGDDYFKIDLSKLDSFETGSKLKYPIKKTETADIANMKEEVRKWPAIEEPSIYGLSNMTDKAYRTRASKDLLCGLIDSLPREFTSGFDKFKDEETKDKLDKDIKQKLPPVLKDIDKRDKKMSPMFNFLSQEIHKFQNIYVTINKAIQEISLAMDGHIIMTPEIEESIQRLYSGKIPISWMYDNLGGEWSWISQSSSYL